jgi:glycosyltransferase involved in cell wall biosynthesis
MSEKKTILVLSDHPMAPSGVAHQTRVFIETMIMTGRYKFICLGGAMKHPNYDPQTITDERWDDGDWMVYPVDGYGNQETIRSIIWTQKPSLVWFMTDPRYFEWLWQIENEVRSVVPMVYYHVWDNYPFPLFNKKWYDSNDVIASISKVTHDIVNNVSPDVENHYLPHAVDPNVFKRLSDEHVEEFKDNQFPNHDDRFVFFWNNRNARRKQSGTLIEWFNNFAEEVGPENVCLIMHTDPKDPQGQDLNAILIDKQITDGRVMFSSQKMPPEGLSLMYNMADCTINISDAEGFGLATLESLSCGTPIIVTMTGGLQEQVTDGKNWFGVGIEPASKVLIGSQNVPYIHEDRISEKDFNSALHKIYGMSQEERTELGKMGMKHVEDNYNFEELKNRWIEIIDQTCEKFGCWENRTGYKAWSMESIT